jgi:hypothetical protein
MPAYINDKKQIAFESGRGIALNADWKRFLRGDVYDGGVGFDATGLCLLDADECRELALWLFQAAELLPPKAEPIKRRGRKPMQGRHNEAA